MYWTKQASTQPAEVNHTTQVYRGEERMAQHVIPAPGTPEKIRVLAADSTRMSSQLLAEALV